MILLFIIYVNGDTTGVVKFEGDEIEFVTQSNLAILRGNAWVNYGDITVTADSIYYYVDEKIVKGYGNVVVKTSYDSLRGTALKYSLNTEKGVMYNGKTEIEKGFFDGKEIYLVEKNVFFAHNCRYTTCDDSIPHYYFWTRDMKILVNNTAIARPVVMFVENIPVLAAPFWMFPISKKRKSGFLPFKAGQSTDEGLYAKRMAYYLVINDYSDATFSLDIMEKKGIKPSLEFIYIVNPYVKGNFMGSYIKEWDTGRQRWSIGYNHSSIFLFNSSLRWHIDYQSDASYESDYAEDEIVWLKKEMRSSVTLSKNFRIFSTGITGSFYKSFESMRENYILPSISLSIVPISLFKVISMTNSFLFLNSVRKDTLSSDTTRTLDYRGGLSISSSLFNIFTFNHSTSFSQTFNFMGNNKNSYSHTTGLSFSMFRVFSPVPGKLHGVLHKITPSISHSFSPFSDTTEFFNPPQYDSLISNSISINIAQFFQGKFGDKEVKKDLLLWNTSMSYSFISHEFSPLSMRFSITDIPRVKLNFEVRYDFKIKEFDYSITAGGDLSNLPLLFFLGDSLRSRYRLNLNYYQSSQGDRRIVLTTGFNLTRNWNISGSGTYNLDTGELVSYNFIFKRDLHCWEGIIRFNALGDEKRFEMELRIKEIPEISLSKKTFGFILE